MFNMHIWYFCIFWQVTICREKSMGSVCRQIFYGVSHHESLQGICLVLNRGLNTWDKQQWQATAYLYNYSCNLQIGMNELMYAVILRLDIKINLRHCLGFYPTLLKRAAIKWAATWQNQQSECAPGKDSDEPGNPPILIRVFAVHSVGR